jgi:hypothetical protein
MVAVAGPSLLDVDDERERWYQPLDLAQLGELTARWLEGETWSPWQTGSPPSDETEPLAEALAEMNRLGFVTIESQPGVGDPRWPQRAHVDGLCNEEVADRLAGLSLGSDLVVITHYPRVEATYEIPVSLEDGRTCTIAAGAMPADGLWADMHAETVRAVADAWQVTVLDPQWGRNDLLWEAVRRALRDPDATRGRIVILGG